MVVTRSNQNVIDKQLYIGISAEGGFGGDIDQRLINMLLKSYDPKTHDIIIIGSHGAMQLRQSKIEYKKFYKLPKQDKDINVGPLIEIIGTYRSTTVYYQSYESLMSQQIKAVELKSAVQAAGKRCNKQVKRSVRGPIYLNRVVTPW